MISVSSAIPDDFTNIISIASGMKSAGETVFSIPPMIIDVTATIPSVTNRLLSVPDKIVCGGQNRLRRGEDPFRDGNNYLESQANPGKSIAWRLLRRHR